MTDKSSKPASEAVSDPTVTAVTGSDGLKRRKSANWRLSVLATAKHARPKYVEPPYIFNSGVSPDALKAPPNERVEEMAVPKLRSLYVNKKEFTGNPNTFKDFDVRMDKQIDKAWNTTYLEYRKAKRDKRLKQEARLAQLRKGRKGAKKGKAKKEVLAKKAKDKEKPEKKAKDKEKPEEKAKDKEKPEKKGKDKEKPAKKGKKSAKSDKSAKHKKKDADAASEKSEDLEKQLEEWIDKNAQPKKVFEPPPIQRGPVADLDMLKDRIESLSKPMEPVTPKYVPRRPPKHIVKEEALKYVPTDRVLELAKAPAFWSLKEEPIVLGSVSPAALKYKPTKRTEELATPRARASANDADLKEDPFTISKNALKYKATPRIIELAKPIERK